MFGILLSLPWLQPGLFWPGPVHVRGGCLVGWSLQPGHMQPVFGFLNLHLNQIVRVQEPCLVARIEAGGVTTLFEW